MPPATGKRLWHLDSFSGGIDRRDGSFTETQSRSYDLVNMRVKNNKRAVRRPPCSRNATQFVNAQGLIEWRGALYTVAKKGDVVTKPATVTGELRFDNPDHCTTWELGGLLNFGGFPVALIKHTYPGGTVTHQWRLHVFDGKANKPTYVEDPWCPIGFGPSLPLHVYRTGSPSAFDADYVPRMTVCGGRLYISRPDGNVAFSKTGNARTWNERTVEQMADEGEWWYFITTATSGVQEFIISEDFARLYVEGGWACFILEACTTDGTWYQCNEIVGSLTALAMYQVQSVASRFAGGYTNEIKLRVYWDAGGGTVLRFRLLFKPPITTADIVASADAWGRKKVSAGTLLMQGVPFQIDAVDEEGYGTATSMQFQFVDNVTTQQDITHRTNAESGQSWYATISSIPTDMWRENTTGASTSIQTRDSGWTQAPGGGDWRTLGGRYCYNNLIIGKWTNPTVGAANAVTASAFSAGETRISLTNSVQAGDRIIVQPGLNYATCYIALDTGNANIRIRDTTNVAGDYTADVTIGSSVYDWNEGVTYTPIYYGHEEGHQSQFYIERTLEYQLNLSGADDAGELPTASQQGADGGYVTALCAMKDRLLVSYVGGTQLWQASGLPDDFALLGFGPVGTGDQVYPEPRAVGQSVVLGMARGLMSLNLSGSNLDSLRDINLGEPIEDLGFPQQQDAAFWPITGEYVTPVEMPDGSFQFLVFDYSPEQKITSWSRWTVADLPEVERFTMVAMGRKLYFRADGYLYDFDEAGTDFIDAHDDPDEPYESVWMPHFNHFKAPFRQKQCLELEWVMSGTVTVSVRWNPDLPDEETGELVYTGPTAGRAKVPAPVWGHGLAPVVRSRDRTGFEIEEFGMWFKVQGR